MKTIICPYHNNNITTIYYYELYKFVDNNKREVTIIIDKEGNKSLKRYIMGICDENCPKVKEIMEIPDIPLPGEFSVSLFLNSFAKQFNPLERLELSKEAPSFIIELQYRNFAEIKMIRDYLYSQQKLTQEQITKFNNLFLEQGINLDNL